MGRILELCAPKWTRVRASVTFRVTERPGPPIAKATEREGNPMTHFEETRADVVSSLLSQRRGRRPVLARKRTGTVFRRLAEALILQIKADPYSRVRFPAGFIAFLRRSA